MEYVKVVANDRVGQLLNNGGSSCIAQNVLYSVFAIKVKDDLP